MKLSPPFLGFSRIKFYTSIKGSEVISLEIQIGQLFNHNNWLPGLSTKKGVYL